MLSVRFRLLAHQKIWDKDEAEDVVQDALAVISKEFSGLQIETSFAAWAYKVLDNRIMACIKAQRTIRRRMEGAVPTDMQADQVTNPDLMLKLEDCLRKVVRANQRYARILNFCYQGYSMDEICRRLSITRNHAYVLLSRARSMLQLCLDKGEI